MAACKSLENGGLHHSIGVTLVFSCCDINFFFCKLPLLPGIDFKMKTLELDGIKVRAQIWWVHVAPAVRWCAASVCHSVFICAGTQRVRNGIRPSPNSTTGARRWCQHALSASWRLGLLSNLSPCAGYHLYLWHHKPAVLPAPRQVGQWRGRSEPSVMNSALSGWLEHVCDGFLLFSSMLQTWCSGFWWETNVMRKSGGRWQKTKEARFGTRSFD